MLNWEILRKTAVPAVGLMIWMMVVPSLAMSAQGEDILAQARRLVEDGELEAAAALLEPYVAKLKGEAGQKRNLAEAGYVLARVDYLMWLDEKSDEALRLIFAAVPDYAVPEPNKYFLARVERIRSETAAKATGERQKIEAVNNAMLQKKIEEARRAEEKQKAEEAAKAGERKEAEAKRAAPAAEKPTAIPGKAEGGEAAKKKGRFPWLIVGGVVVVAVVAAILLKKKSGSEAATTTTTTVAPTTGDISVASTPSGAKVSLDASDTGKTTPCTLTEIAPGSHALMLELSGYGRWSGSVQVNAGQTADVSVTLAGYAYEYVLQWGTQGTGNGQLWNPAGIAVDSSGDVFVADSGNFRIHKFDSQGAYLRRWGGNGSGNDEFRKPLGVACDAAGNVYVADTENYRVIKYNSNGDYLDQWGMRGSGNLQFNLPQGLAVDAAGNIYVADTDNHRIQKLSSRGEFLAQWGSPGSGDGQFNRPAGIAVDASGNVYVSELGNHRIQKLSAGGAYVAKWGSYGNGDGQFNSPTAVAVDSSRRVYVADSNNNRVQKFSEGGTFMTKWGSAGSGNSQFNQTWGLAVDGSGFVYVTDYSNHRVQKFRITANTVVTVTYSPLKPGKSAVRKTPAPPNIRIPASDRETNPGAAEGAVVRPESRKCGDEKTIR
jgi:sugar lactone lactonase YvrE